MTGPSGLSIPTKSRRGPIRAGYVVRSLAFQYPQIKLGCKLGFEVADGANEGCTRFKKNLAGGKGPVGLDFEDKVGLQRMRDLVSGKNDGLVGKQLAVRAGAMSWRPHA